MPLLKISAKLAAEKKVINITFHEVFIGHYIPNKCFQKKQRKKAPQELFGHILQFVVPDFRSDPLTARGTPVTVFGLEISHIDRRSASFAGDVNSLVPPRYFLVFFIR